MKIVWLLRYLPLPPMTGGDAVYSFNLLRSLADVMPVDALSFATPDVVPTNEPGITWHVVDAPLRNRHASVATLDPGIAFRHRVPAYVDAALALAETADAVVVDHIGLLWMVERLKRGRGRGPAVVAINHDHEGRLRTELARSIRNPVLSGLALWDGWKSQRLERRAMGAADGYTAITETDLAAFRAEAPGVPALLAMPGYRGPVLARRTIDESVPERVAIIGGRASFHKQLVLEMILAEIERQGVARRIAVDVVGSGNDFVERMRRRHPSINFLGYVDDIAGYMKTARMGLIPDEVGGGFKLRALTHVHLRTPMLALRKALAGMTLRDGFDYIGADDIPGLVSTLPRAISDFDLLNRVQETAFDRCSGRFDWRSRGQALARFLETVADVRSTVPVRAPATAGG